MAKQKILIAEDSLTQAIQLRALLESEGYEVIHGKDGQEASVLFEEVNPDLVVSDVMMPNMNGYELTDFIKSKSSYPETPVLLLTSLFDKSDVIRGLACGGNSFVSKPYNKENLLETVDKLLNHVEIDPDIKSILDSDKNAKKYDNTTIRFLISAYETAINKSKALEESQDELKAINQNQEKIIKERTKELEEAKALAEKSDMLKSIFLSNVSHDLRTPMNAIIGFSELLKDDDCELKERDEYLDFISKNGDILLNLINDIIDISKIEAGIITCNKFSDCNVYKLFDELERNFKQFQFLKNSRNVDLFFDKKNVKENLIIKTDPFRLNQILSNLLSNAVKFTKTGSIEFSYELIDEESILFYVKDTGIGIPDDKIGGLFQRYQQVKTSDSPTVGTGLGLAIAENLTKLLGGRMWIESELGKGSTFSFILPYEAGSSNPIDHFQKAPKEHDSYDFKKGLFLIVEDDLSNYNYLKALLRKANAEVIWARDGETAISMFQENPAIKLVLMDINLPKMNGLTVTRKILELNSEMPIIAQTAYAMSGDEEECLKAGCTDYISKPLKPLLLLSKIENNLLKTHKNHGK